MVLHPLRLRGALSISLSVLRNSRQGPQTNFLWPSFSTQPYPHPNPYPYPPTLSSYQTATRFFTSATSFLGKSYVIFSDGTISSGMDYNHWLITIDFPKDSNLTRGQMIGTYVNTAAQVFGSVEEAKKKIYALSTTTYQGFQVECSEETSEKFKNIPGVVFVLPDSYIDPVNKEYAGDKYVNGESFPRPPPPPPPPPLHYGRRSNKENRRGVLQHGQLLQYGEIPTPGLLQHGQPLQYVEIPTPGFEVPPPRLFGQGPTPQQNYGDLLQYGQGSTPQQNHGQELPPQQNYGGLL